MTELETIPLPKQYKILLIGDDCIDVYEYGYVDRISPEAPVPIFKHSYKEERGGMARNVKSNLENLGCQVIYHSGNTSIKTRLIDIRSRQHILRIDNDQRSQPLNFTTIDYYDIDAIVISDYGKGTVSYDLIQHAIETKLPVFVDTKKTDLEKFQGAWVKINELEYDKIESECSGLIVTLGNKGAVAKHHNIQLPAKNVEVADVCGAGDTFLSALTYSWLNNRDIKAAMTFAIKASAITVQKLGAYAPSLEEIISS